MASNLIANQVQCPVSKSRLSSLFLSPSRIPPALVAIKSRSLASRASGLAFSPLTGNVRASSSSSSETAEVTNKVLRFSLWNRRLRNRGSGAAAEFPVAKAAAADADGSEIEISDGCVFAPFFFSLLFSLFCFVLC